MQEADVMALRNDGYGIMATDAAALFAVWET